MNRLVSLVILAVAIGLGPTATAQDPVVPTLPEPQAEPVAPPSPPDPAVVEAERRLAEKPDSPERLYNLGVALFRAGDRSKAGERFREAATLARSADLAARAMYNEGVAAYSDAVEALAKSGPDGAPPDPAALEEISKRVESAFTHFRDAATADPTDREARGNAENARELLRLLKQAQQQQDQQKQDQQKQDQQKQDQQKQDQQKQDQQKQDQQKQDQQKQDQQKQDQQKQDQQKQDQQKQDQQKQDQQQQDQQQQDQQKQDQQQQDQQKQDRQKQDQQQQDQQQQDQQQQDQQQQDQQQQDQQKQDQQKQDQQKQDQQKQDQQKQDQQKQDQQDSGGEQSPPEEKRPQGSLDRAEQQPPQGEPKPAAQAAPGTMSRDEAERLLQAVRDRERARRAALAEKVKAERARTPPARKDW